MVGKENLAIFDGSNISETKKATPIKIGDPIDSIFLVMSKGKFGHFRD